MKKIIYRFCFAVLSLTYTSCKDSLNLPPEDFFGDGNYWQTESQVVKYMDGMHSRFRSHTFQYFVLGELRGGALDNSSFFPVSLNSLEIINQELSETSPGVTSWGGFYNSILQTNLFIHKVESINFIEESKKDYLLGQAYSLRSFYYFHLLRTYGGVPLRLIPDITEDKPDAVELRLPRSTEEEVLNAIKKDIDKAIEYFGNKPSNDKSYWNTDAARMLKGEIYLWSAKVYNNIEDATAAKKSLTDINGYNLLTDFEEVFQEKKNSEIILSIHNKYREAELPGVSLFLYDTPSFSSMYYKDTLDVDAQTLQDPLELVQSNAQAIQRYRYKYSFFDEYDLNDQRREATFYDFYALDRSVSPQKVTGRNTAMIKFLGEINNNIRHYTNDWPVYREADRLLLLAEIANLLDEDPSQYIQKVRDRAYNGNDLSPFVNSNKSENELAIFKERAKEFVFEGKRWYDLRRMKYNNIPLVFKSEKHIYGVLNQDTESHKILWPIERALWTDDPLVEQTPGYQTSK